jgi:hypothetical protein
MEGKPEEPIIDAEIVEEVTYPPTPGRQEPIDVVVQPRPQEQSVGDKLTELLRRERGW